MTLIAPDHLRGRMTRHTPQQLRAERISWITASYAAGHSQGDIADALGIGQSALSTAMLKAGIIRRLAPPEAKRLSSMGLRIGRMDRLFDGLPPETRVALVDEAARKGSTIADAIAARLAPPKNGSGEANA